MKNTLKANLVAKQNFLFKGGEGREKKRKEVYLFGPKLRIFALVVPFSKTTLKM
jgi:hypothetical protein